MQLARLNGDASWLLTCGEQTLAIDPWLLGPEVDCCVGFNSATLRLPPTPPAAIAPTLTAILVTQGFSDHCHEETLLQLLALAPARCALYAAPGALARLRGGPHPLLAARAQPLADLPQALPGWRAQHVAPPLLAPTHGAVLLCADSAGSVLIAPHGLEPAGVRSAAALCASAPRPLAVLATTTTFALPWYVGGTVNLGLAAAAALCAALAPEVFHTSHDEDKEAAGWVAGAASRRYCARAEVAAAIPALAEAPWVTPPAPALLADAAAAAARASAAPPPLRQLPLASALAEAGGSAAELRARARAAPPLADAAADCVRVTRAWNARARTHTFHAHAFVAGVGSAGGALLARVAELFFRAYELERHGWYQAFSSGTVTRAPWHEAGVGQCTSGWGVFDLGLGAPRAYHTLFVRTGSSEEGWASIVLRSVTPAPAPAAALPAGAVHVYLLPPTGDYFVLADGGLHWHHICTVAGVRILPGCLDGGLMTLLRSCGGDGKERGAYQVEAEAFVRYVKEQLRSAQQQAEGAL